MHIRRGRQLAIFDFDWTLVKPRDGRQFPKSVHDWQWLRPNVPEVVKSYASTHEIVIRSDQTKLWKLDMIKAAMDELQVPYTAVVSMSKKDNKPNTRLFTEEFDAFDAANSFFVGDAAGRDGDWSDCDMEFAKSLGVRFAVPEDMFPLAQNTESIEALVKTEREVVIMVGYPASGKSTVSTKLIPYGYVRIDGDVLKTGAKMRREANKYVKKSSIIFDATNGTAKKRAEFIQFAKDHGLSVRVIWMQTTIDEAMNRNKQRANDGGTNIPAVVYYTYRKRFEEPTTAEGISVIEKM
jgi:bifunctional polynucleotide phosphatase/kinase